MDGSDEVIFMGKYKDWIAIKKLRIIDNTKPEEVSAALASIENTVVRKGYEFTGLDVDAVDEYVEKLAKGKRKGWNTLIDTLKSVKPGEIKAVLLEACKNVPKAENAKKQNPLPMAEAYFMKTLLETLGYKTVLDGKMLQEAFPHLKIPKPKGNFGKKKKKKK